MPISGLGGGGGGGGATTIADGASVTLGSKADAKSTATDTTAVTIMSVLKQVSASIQTVATAVSASLGPGEEHVGSVGSNTARIYINPTITAGAYSAGDVVGGRLTLTNWSRLTALGTRNLGVHIVDVGNVKADLDFLLFDSLPTANIADNGAWAWNSADYDNLVMHFSVLSTEYTSVGAAGLCSKSLSGFPVVPAGSANVYMYIVCRATPTYAATTNLHISFGPDRD